MAAFCPELSFLNSALGPIQQRCATVELECLGIVWAVSTCAFYLKGLPSFKVVTDHRPLEGVFRKNIFDIPNPRLQRMREKLTGYTFNVQWVPGKMHDIADTLSRASLFAPEEDSVLQVDTALSCLTITQDPAMSVISDNIDEDYRQCCDDILNSTFKSPLMTILKNLRSRLSVNNDIILLDSTHIVVPRMAVKSCFWFLSALD